MTRFIKLSLFLIFTVSLPLNGKAFAGEEIFPASDCQAELDALWATILANHGSPDTEKIAEWGVGVIKNVKQVNKGTKVWLEDTDRLENCTDACGCEGKTLPKSITGAMSATVNFTDSVTTTVTSGISAGTTVTVGIPGNTFSAAINAKLEASAGTTHGHQTTKTQSISVTLPPCQWQIIYAKLKVIKGNKKRVTATLQPHIRLSKNSNVLVATGLTQTVTHTVTVNSAVQSSASGGTESSGSCPPEPPF